MQTVKSTTSLQTKGFVVLSGISGTGKSKIATGFVEMLPNPTSTQSVAPKVDLPVEIVDYREWRGDATDDLTGTDTA